MSGNINVARPGQRRRVLMIAANPSVSSVTGWPVGFWWSELTHPYWTFVEVGFDVEIRSPDGGTLVADSYSDPDDPSGYSANDILSLGFKRSARHAALLENTAGITDVDVSAYDAIFVCGGQSPMFTFIEHSALHSLVAEFYDAGKVTALVCHGTCVLLRARGSNGELLVKNKTWTGFANSEEDFADSVVGRQLQPFRIELQARQIPDTNFIVDQPFRAFAVRDGLLVTGQQQNSGAAAARLVIEAVGR